MQHIKRIPYPVDLSALSSVELHTTEHFGAPTFHALGNGSFLQFLASQPKSVEALGGQCIGSSMDSQHVLHMKETLISFISQLKTRSTNDKVSGVRLHNCGSNLFIARGHIKHHYIKCIVFVVQALHI